jgi:hypothetical protein
MMPASDNVKVKIVLNRKLSEITKKYSYLKFFKTSEEADNDFSSRSNAIFKELYDIDLEFTGKKLKVVIDDIRKLQDYPTSTDSSGKSCTLDMKEWKITGHVDEFPKVKLYFHINAYGQGYLGRNGSEINAHGESVIEK